MRKRKPTSNPSERIRLGFSLGWLDAGSVPPFAPPQLDATLLPAHRRRRPPGGAADTRVVASPFPCSALPLLRLFLSLTLAGRLTDGRGVGWPRARRPVAGHLPRLPLSLSRRGCDRVGGKPPLGDPSA